MYDLIIAGGGPAGYAAAVRTAQMGAKVLMVEKDKVGGTCLHRGCIPTKVLHEHAQTHEKSINAFKSGFFKGDITLDLSIIKQQQQETVSKLYTGLQNVLKNRRVKIVKGSAVLKTPDTMVVQRDEGKEEYHAHNILIATGSREAELDIPGSKIISCVDESLHPPQKICSVAIIGGGYTGLELASSYISLGFEVTVIEREKVLLSGLEDNELSKMLAFLLRRRGIKILTNTTLLAVECVDDEISLLTQTSSREQVLKFHKVISAVGRRPNMEVLGSGIKGIEITSQGITVNQRQETGVSHVYAAGDVTGPPLLAHLSYFEGIAAAENIMGLDKVLDKKAVPFFLAAQPGMAWVGITEKQAKDLEIPCKMGRFSFNGNGRAVVKGHSQGLVKIVIRESDEVVLGMQVLGNDAEDLIIEGVLAVQNALTLKQMVETIHPHPTLGEAVWEASLSAWGKPLHG
ncbi:dihydrolipoyl dehydrogenase [Candidatus Contubernalis alkaliaceticus]|uniref:dihydrolipoyl dehydrogenase n=1 Tax=Candidatus Contubernalis alkaliaceticus TaxID=338645 RepID=UPI001F4C0B49|nr:dihydrolipoyl dehydrogenase [Candidatus Contubernalis alkalaceticus]UNC91585.1 dihydrolipoyl dehydrogenase [Candidatus Contubernalis alkalaceticus]